MSSLLHFIDKVTGIYRILQESSSHSNNIRKRILFKISECNIRLFFANKYLSTQSDYLRNRCIYWNSILLAIDMSKFKSILLLLKVKYISLKDILRFIKYLLFIK